MVDRRLEGEILVVTGGANGIGQAVAAVALTQGASVAVIDIERASLPIVDRKGTFLGVEADITDERALEAAFATIATQLGQPSILVNNAGRNSNAEVGSMTSAEWDSFFALDLKAAWLCSKQVIRGMQPQGGSIVNVASVHAHMTAEGAFPYAAAKAGLLGLTRSMALDLGVRGIRVNSVSPGYTRTRLVDDELDRSSDVDLRAEIDSKHALRRIGEPVEIARVICFLASSEASFVTGADWIVDGGISARFA